MKVGKHIADFAVNNPKGVVFKAVGTLVGGLAALFIGGKVEDVLNNKFNPELTDARERYASSVDDLMSMCNEPSEQTAENETSSDE